MAKKHSRRGFVTTLGITAGSFVLIGCGTNPTATPAPTAPATVAPTASASPTPLILTGTATAVSPTTVAVSSSGGSTLSCTPTRNVAQGGTPQLSFPEPPVRSSVENGHILRGTVQSSRNCEPLKQAKLVFWWANTAGKYDDAHQATIFTKDNGTFELESNFPGQYEGASPHFHLIVWADNHQPIETSYNPRIGQTEGNFAIVLAPK
jgi:protocatechuate 3,4-dioxygenase beta subunit